MFTQVENSLKVTGKAIVFAGILLSVILGIVSLSKGYSFWVPLGLGLLIGGSLSSLVSGLLMYGIGELIETNKLIEKNTQISPTTKSINEPEKPTKSIKQNVLSTTSSKNDEQEILKKGGWRCSSCGRVHYSYESSCICGDSRFKSNLSPKESVSEKDAT